MEILRNAGLALLFLTTSYGLMILWFTKPLFRKKNIPFVTAELPFVSVIIAARNEEKNIRTCLEGILAQDYPAHCFEIIVSDDHSTDGTETETERAISLNPLVLLSFLKSTPTEGTGKKAAILRAVRTARGELILTTDADTRRNPGWIRSMSANYIQQGTRMVLGPVILEGENFFQKLQSLEFMGVMGLTAGSAIAGIPLMCNGANFMYGKKELEETNGLAASLRFPSGDDQFLLAAFRKRYGGRSVTFALQPEAIVRTDAESTLAGFIHQRNRWVSKSRGYRDPAVITAGAVTYLLHTALLAGIIAGMFSLPFLFITLACWALKMTAELPMVAGIAFFSGRGKLLWLYIPAQLFQLLYVPFTGLSGLILPYRWKGRVIRA